MKTGLYIDNQWAPASNGAVYQVPNPATEAVIGSAPDATVEDMRRAIGAARRAFDDGPWRRTTAADRAKAIEKIADAMERRKEEMRVLVVAEAGATHLTHGVQIDAPIGHLRHWAELARTFAFDEPLLPRAGQGPFGPQMNSTIVHRQPVGVCGMIPTWNFPIYVFAQKLGPALAAGCTMVFKASPYGPLSNLFMAELIAEADLPPGVVNVVTGQSNAIAEALVTDPRIDKISFTGSVATGRKIIEASASNLKRVHLELGGKSVSIFLDPDDDMAVPTACGPSFFHSGQGCAMATRVLVPKDKHDAFVERMAGFTKIVTIGDPADPANMMGPVVREERRQKILEYIESGKKEGAKLVAGGGIPKSQPKGYFVEPTIFAAVPNRIRIAQEEIFGPVVSVIPFEDEADAIRIANDSSYGLGGAIYTKDTAKAVAMAKQIRTGVVWINNGLNQTDGPFGGFKESGIGREGGKWGLEEYTEVQQITWRT
jgi:predicted outer membrane repeat protein